jgi:hypothetical protein
MTTRGAPTMSQARIEVLGISADAALRRRAAAAVSDALARLTVRPIIAHVTFVDDDGPEGRRAPRSVP